ncbi:hypothetical protein DYBT9275_02710 [Dyadobacter sp. CECT 9275]|uniref:HTH cro/C1-type domain-containing protein n=1 Tax=Dyadobacter helix TaxID=2822344 RepID=A0A916JEP3_9BACT|nr:helix-turn-helix transcriptional regulator [Dyadobacter sp. CECT 9275]CAG5001641.1 hypothetical protein DYBT9275_02710 [Dyadobacter sp. CECT 9275]
MKTPTIDQIVKVLYETMPMARREQVVNSAKEIQKIFGNNPKKQLVMKNTFKQGNLWAALMVSKATKNISLDEAAFEIGVSRSTMYRIRDNHPPSVETLGRICKWLKVSPLMFYDLSD